MARDTKYAPECPFCSRFIDRPEKILTGFGETLANRCRCGAVYVCDPTGRNLGEAFTEALALLMGNWDFDNLNADSDYFTREINYDLKTHREVVVKGEVRSAGRLIFVNRTDTHKKEGGVMKTDRNIKQTLKILLSEGDYQKIAEMAEDNQAVISKLISMTYDKEDVLTWRAIESFKTISKRLTPIKPGLMRDTIRRLLWSMSDESGGIGWSACEIIGCITSANPSEYSEMIPLLWSYREEENFRPGALWAMAQIGLVDASAISFICNDIEKYFSDPSPCVKAYAAYCSKIARCKIAAPLRITNPEETFTCYKDGELKAYSVSEFIAMTL